MTSERALVATQRRAAARMTARWKVSDVFDALARDPSIGEARQHCAVIARDWALFDSRDTSSPFPLNDDNVGTWLGKIGSAAVAVGSEYLRWSRLSDAQRCAAVVREARRLKVEKRA